MNKLCLIFFFFVVSSFSLYATPFSKKFKFEVTPTIGIATGKVNEYVFENGNTLSRLDWQPYVMPMLGVDGGVTFYGAFVKLGFGAAIPVPVGIMEDFDWIAGNVNNANRIYRYKLLTDYSKHNLQTEMGFDLRAKIGYEFEIKWFSISPSLGVLFKIQKWTASGGYKKGHIDGPPGVTDNTPKSYFSGKVIDYDQRIFLLSLGVDTEFRLPLSWRLSLGVSFIPFMYAQTLDKHYKRTQDFPNGTQFLDTMIGGLGVAINMGVQWKRAKLMFEWEYFVSEKGVTDYGEIGSAKSELFRDSGNSGTRSSMFTVLFGWRFGNYY